MPPPRQKPPVQPDSATVPAWPQAACHHPAAHHRPAGPESSTAAWAETRAWPPPRRTALAVVQHCRWPVRRAVQAQTRLASCAPPSGRKRTGVSSWWPCSTAPAWKSVSTAPRGPVQSMHSKVNPTRWPASARPPAASTTPPSATPAPPYSADAQPEAAEAEAPAGHWPTPTGRRPPQR